MKSSVVLGVAALVGAALLFDTDSSQPVARTSPAATPPPEHSRSVREPLRQIEIAEQQPPAQLVFRRDVCTIDCSGHEAGYAWAEEQGIDDPDDCRGNSESFIEGCRAYATEQQQESAAEVEDDEEENQED